ncbi:hypothetical protein ACFPYJ_23010 [Paenibacillus solisilvae]|uniref:Short-chain dehydrogenase n=1 Tax=Paenibacillus solisilvae TaxID=2486751 RepID=A0ABW0W1B1_9BACL
MTMYTVLIILAGAVCVFSLVSSIYYIRKQESKELDKSINLSTVKHSIIGNPALIAYLALPIIIILGAIILSFFKK